MFDLNLMIRGFIFNPKQKDLSSIKPVSWHCLFVEPYGSEPLIRRIIKQIFPYKFLLEISHVLIIVTN
jgi:hypothetical protein